MVFMQNYITHNLKQCKRYDNVKTTKEYDIVLRYYKKNELIIKQVQIFHMI